MERIFETAQQVILQGLPVIGGLIFTILFSTVLHRKAHDLAVAKLFNPYLTNNKIQELWEDDLNLYLRWRDLFTSVMTGIFVLEFTAAEQVGSKLVYLADAAILIIVVIVPVALLFVLYFLNRHLVHYITFLYLCSLKRV